MRLILVALLALPSLAHAVDVTVNPASPGLVFEGLGALSAGASSRLLMDYPEKQRSDILDFLFKPKFGAGFHHLKVEIGGDVNSTDGTEPSFARTREEFENPKPQYFQRGYEYWLMQEARRRNPGIRLDALQWGAPGWIGASAVPATRPAELSWEQRKARNRIQFYSQDNANFIVAFIKGAAQYHDVQIDYCGIWNETNWDNDWIKRLRSTLDDNNLKSVKIVAADQCGRRPWEIAKDILKDKQLADAVHIIGAHYPGMMRKDQFGDDQYDASPEAKQTGKVLWSSEDGPWRGDWQGAATLAKIFNRNYIRGKMTKTIIWSLITSYYDNLPLPGSGPMRANTPWSGHYEVQPAIWAIAHTTQFTQPGWRYIDSACGIIEGQASYVTMISPSGNDCSIIIETVDARAPVPLKFKLPEAITDRPLYLWRSSEKKQFELVPEVPMVDDVCTLTAEPGSIYSLTTTTGQRRGDAVIPPAAEFPLPYRNDFELIAPGKYAPCFSDQAGVFEVAERSDGQGRCLRQTVNARGIDWNLHPNSEPYTVLGSTKWRNLEVSCRAQIEGNGFASILGRVTHCPQTEQPAKAYALKLHHDGRWELAAQNDLLAKGRVQLPDKGWHMLKLRMVGLKTTAFIDEQQVAEIEDFRFTRGMAGLGTGWNHAQFDDLTISPLNGPDWVNLAAGKPAIASSRWEERYDARFATDEDDGSRWNSQDGKEAGEWIAVDLGAPMRFTHLLARQFGNRIRRYTIQCCDDGANWKDTYAGNAEGKDQFMAVMPVTVARWVKFRIDSTSGGTPSLYSLQVFDAGTSSAPASRPGGS